MAALIPDFLPASLSRLILRECHTSRILKWQTSKVRFLDLNRTNKNVRCFCEGRDFQGRALEQRPSERSNFSTT
jgi:hypothetical protein